MRQAIVGNINSFLDKFFGIRIKRSRYTLHSVEFPQAQIIPQATYSPWLDDKNFQKIYQVAKNNSLVDEFRMYELWQLAQQAVRSGGSFLEVGVWRGGSSAIIQAAIEQAASETAATGNDIPKFYIADTFKGVVKAGSKEDTLYKGGEHSDTSLDMVEDLFEKLHLTKPDIMVGIFPDDHPDLDIQKIGFVHSDVDAYQSTKDIIEWCMPRLVKGAVLIFDDYGFRGCEGVTSYVNELLTIYPDKFVKIHNLNGHAILISK